uniref:Myozenin 2b n=1 Tax=Fundulus heteroclitus TaxID=8078 RepID=A0A3Q2R166_FUNHE
MIFLIRTRTLWKLKWSHQRLEALQTQLQVIVLRSMSVRISCLADMAAEKLDTAPAHKAYHSPWEQVILSDPNLAETLQLRMPDPEPQQDLPEFKCFNRVATPYGGFEKAPRGITFKLPEVELNPPEYQELSDPRAKRPTFNRTAQGWISEGTHLILPTITLEPCSVPESDDL